MEKKIKTIIAIVLIVAMSFTSVGMTTLAVSIQSFVNYNEGEEKDLDSRYRYYEEYKYEKTTLLMNNNEEETSQETSREKISDEEVLDEKNSEADIVDNEKDKEEDKEEEVDDTEAEAETEAETEETSAEDATVDDTEVSETEVTESEIEETEVSETEEVEIETTEETSVTETDVEDAKDSETVEDELDIEEASSSEIELKQKQEQEEEFFGAKNHTHKICGSLICNHPGVSNHTKSESFVGISAIEEITGDGLYYLTDNIAADTEIGLTGNLTICLNGKNFTGIKFVLNGFDLWITNCQNTGYISKAANEIMFSGTGKVTLMRSLGDANVEVKSDKLITESDNVDILLYNAKLSPITTDVNASVIASVMGNLTIRNSIITGFNKSADVFYIVGSANIIDTIIEENTMTNDTNNAFFNLADKANITFDSTNNASNIVRNNTFNNNFFTRLETEDTENNASAKATINGTLTFDTNKSGALFRLCSGTSSAVVNGTINVLGGTISTNGNYTGSLFTLTKNATLDMKGIINVSKNSNDEKTSIASLIITNGTNSVEAKDPINVNISGDINIDNATFSTNIFWMQFGTKFIASGNIVITNTTSSSNLFYFSGDTSGRIVESLISGNVDITDVTVTTNIISITNGSKCTITGIINAKSFTSNSSNFAYIGNESEWTLSGKIYLSDSTIKFHIFNIINNAKMKIEKNALFELSNDTMWDTDHNNSFINLAGDSSSADIDGTVSIMNGTQIMNVINQSGADSKNGIVNITGNINFGMDGDISDDQKTKVEHFIRSYTPGFNMQVPGNINIINTEITERLIFVEGATEDDPTSMTFSGDFNISKCNFTKTYPGSGVSGHIELGSDNVTISVTGNFSMADTILSQNANFPFIDVSGGTVPSGGSTPASYKSLVEFTGTTTFKRVTSGSFFMFGGNSYTDFTSLRLGGKLIIEDSTFGGSGFVNTATNFDFFAETKATNTTMGRMLWAKNQQLNNEITVPLTFEGCTFNYSVITSRGTLVIKNKIIVNNCSVKQNVISAAEQYSPTGSTEIIESNTGSLDIQDDIIITGTTVLGGSTNYYSGCIVVVGKNFSIADGKTLTIKGNTLHREANKTQSIIKIINDEATFTLNKTGNLIIEDNEMVVDTAGTDNTTISAIYAKPNLKMELGGGKLVVKNNTAIGLEADKNIKDHMFGIYAENPLGFIRQVSGTKFNTNTNVVENVAFNTVDRTGIIYLDWKNGASVPNDFNKVFTADNYGVAEGVTLSFYYDSADGNLWINDGQSVHSHKLCGIDNNETCNHRGIAGHTTMGYLKLVSGSALPTFGSFYLTEDMAANGEITLVSDLYLCLNGHNISNVKFNVGSFELHITNCSEQETTITGPTGNNILFEGGYTSVVSGRGSITLKANRVFVSGVALDKTQEFYNVKCLPIVTTNTTGDIIFLGTNTIISSVSIADYNKSGNCIIYWNTSNPDMEVKMYNTKFVNLTQSAANISAFRFNDAKSVEFYDCEFENCKTTTTSGTNGTLINLTNSEYRFEGCSFKNCSSANRSFMQLNSNSTKLIIKNTNIEDCGAKHHFLFWGATGATMTFEGVNNFINNTMQNSIVYCDGVLTNKGILNFDGNTIAENGFTPGSTGTVFNLAEKDSELNIKNNKFTNTGVGGGILWARYETSVFNIGNVNIVDNEVGGRLALALSSGATCNITGKVRINSNKTTYRLILVQNNELLFNANTSLEMIGNTFIRNNAEQYTYGIDLNDNASLKLDGNATINISDNICDASAAGASTKGVVAAIQVKDSNANRIQIGSGKITIKNNKTINLSQTLDSKNYFYGLYSQGANYVLVQTEGTTFNSQNLIEGVGLNSSDGTGILYDSKGKNYTSNFVAATISNAELRTILFDDMIYISDTNEPHSHKVCGTPIGEVCNHEGIDAHTKNIMYSKISAGNIPTRGNIYLTENLTLASGKGGITLVADLYICLNGYDLNLANTGNQFISSGANYTLYITNCKKDISPTITQANTKWFVNKGGFQIYSVDSEHKINLNADHILALNADTTPNADIVLYNTIFTQRSDELDGTAQAIKFLAASKLIVKNVEFNNYKQKGNDKLFDFDDHSTVNEIYFSDVKFKNLKEVKYDVFAIRTNNPEKPAIFNNVTFENVDLGLHALFAIRQNTTIKFTGDNYINRVQGYSPSNGINGNTYLTFMNNATSKVVIDGNFTLEDLTQNNSTNNNAIFYGEAGNYEINGVLNIKNSTQSANNGSSWVFRDTGTQGGCNVTFNKGSNFSIIHSTINGTTDTTSLFSMTSGKITLNGDINIDELTTNNKFINILDTSDIEMSSGNISIKNSTANSQAIYIGKGIDIGANIEMSNVNASEIIKIVGDCNITGSITLTNNTAKWNVFNVGGNLSLSNNSNLVVEENEIVRQENVSQGIVYIDVKNVEIKALGKVSIKNNKLTADQKGTINTYAGALFVPDDSYLSVSNNQIDISGNVTIGSNKDADEFTHLYGVFSNNVDGFVKLTGNFNQSVKMENIGYGSTDGYGIIVNNYTPKTPPAGITADKIKDNELAVKTANNALWVMSSLPPHQHKTCGLQYGEACNDAAHKGLSNSHELILYSKLASTSVIPTKGSVYLAENITLGSKLTLTNNMYICLNGYTLTLSEVDLAGYHIWTTNCKDDEANIKTTALADGTHTLENGNMSVVAAKGTINIESDMWMRTGDSSDYQYDIEYYNVHMTQVSQGQTNHTITYFDLNGARSSEHKTVLSKLTIEGTNNKGHVFYLSQSEAKLYDIKLKDIVLTERRALIFAYQNENNTVENLIMENVKTQESSNGTQLIYVGTDNTIVTFSGDFKVDDVRGGQLMNISSSNTKKYIINADVDIKNSNFIENTFAIGKGILELNRSVNIENVTSGNSLLWLSEGSFKAESDITIDSYNVTASDQPLLQAWNGSKTEIKGNVNIRNSSVNHTVIDLNNDESEFVVYGDLVIENTENKTTSNSLPLIRCQGTFDVKGNLTIDNSDTINHTTGSVINIVNSNSNFIVEKDFTYKNVTDAKSDNFINVSGNMEVKGNTTYTNMGGKVAINVNDTGKVTLQNLKVTESNLTSLLKTNSENAEIAVKNVEVTNSSVSDGLIYGKNVSVDGNIKWIGNSSNEIFRNNFDITGTVEIVRSTVSNIVLVTDDDFTINKNWTIKNNIFENGILDLAKNLSIADGITVDISENTIKRTNDTQNLINVKTAGSYIDLNKTGVLKIQNNIVNAEVSPDANKNFAIINLANSDNVIKLGNGIFNLSENVLEATGAPLEADTNIIIEVLSKNTNGVITQNEGTKFDVNKNYVGLVAFNDGNSFVDGIIFANWTSDNVSNIKPTSHSKVFEYLELTQADLFFGLTIDADNNLWLKNVSHDDHLICGNTETEGHTHHIIEHDPADMGVINYEPLKDIDLLKNGGKYYLVSDLIYDTVTTITPDDKLVICLNGFNVKNVKFRSDVESGKDIIIANCTTNRSVVEYSGSDALFDNISLFGKEENVEIRANKVVDGSIANVFSVVFSQYSDAKVDSLFKSEDLKLENAGIEGFANKTSIIKGTNAHLYNTYITNNTGSQFVADMTGELILDNSTNIYNNELSEGIINTNDLTLHAKSEDSGGVFISENIITRQNKTQTLIKTAGEVTYDGDGLIYIGGNEVKADIDTAKTNILSMFNFSQAGAIVYNGQASINLSNNKITDESKKPEVGGNHIYSIYTTSEGPIFAKGEKVSAKFNANDTQIIGIAFGTENNVGTIFESWTAEYVAGELSDYKGIFVSDEYFNPDIIVRKMEDNIVTFKSTPFVLEFVAGELLASDEKVYKASGTVNNVSKAIDIDDETGDEHWLAILPQINYTLEGAKKLGWQLYGDSSVFYPIEEVEEEDEIDFADIGERFADKHIKFIASWSEISYTMVFDLQGGVIDGEGSFPTTLMYYEKSEPLPKASKSESEFYGYKFMGFNPAQPADVLPNKESFKAGDVVHKLFDLEDNVEIMYYANFIDADSMFTAIYYDDTGAEIATTEYFHLNNPKVGDGVNITKSGYTLQGFATTQGGAVVYKKGQPFDLAGILNNDVVELYTVWKQNPGGGGNNRGSYRSGGGGGGGGKGLVSTGVIGFGYNYSEPKAYIDQYAVAIGNKSHNELNNNILWSSATDGSIVANRVVVTATGVSRVEQLRDGMFFINWNNKNCVYAFDQRGNMVTGFILYNGKLYYMAETGAYKGAMAAEEVYVDGVKYDIDVNGAVKQPINSQSKGKFIYDVDAGQYRYILQGISPIYAVNTTVAVTTQTGEIVNYIFGIDGLMRVGNTTINGVTYNTYAEGPKYGQIIK